MLRVSLMYAFRRSYGLPYKMGIFIAAKGLFNKVYNVLALKFEYFYEKITLYKLYKLTINYTVKVLIFFDVAVISKKKINLFKLKDYLHVRRRSLSLSVAAWRHNPRRSI